MANLILMIGAPGSGKSTFCKEHLLSSHPGYYISRDEIRYSLLEENDDYFSKENEVMSTFIFKVDEALARNTFDVYADATHLTPASRKKLLSKLKNKPNTLVAVYMDTDLDIILKQNAQRTGREFVPEFAVIKMYHSIELPTPEEGFNKLIIVKNGELKTEIKMNYKEKSKYDYEKTWDIKPIFGEGD